MKKLKRFFGVFVVALFMLSTSSIQGSTTVELKKEKDCFSKCDLVATVAGDIGELTHQEEYAVFSTCYETFCN
ncbi:MAG: hypothetical protein ACPG41_06760 [Lacinutrix venerupis]